MKLFIYVSALGAQSGSLQTIIACMCQTDVANARTETQRRYVDCKGSDLNCPALAR